MERRRRLVKLGLVFFLFFYLPLLLRLGWLTVVRGPELARQAWKQQTWAVGLEDIPRGQIYDRNLKPLTDSYTDWRIIVFPALVKNKVHTAMRLANLLGQPLEEILARFNGEAVILPYPVSQEAWQSVHAYRWPGVMLKPVTFRYGPHPLAANVLGYLGYPDQKRLSQLPRGDYRRGELLGRAGLEALYDRELRDVSPEGVAAVVKDGQGRMIKGLQGQNGGYQPSKRRRHLVLTLDARVQRLVETVLDHRQLRGAVVVMKMDGDLLALASRPTFHPAQLPAQPEPLQFVDRTMWPTEPGSVFKLLVAAAALEEGLVTPQTWIECSKVPGVKVNVPHPKGGHTLQEALAYSCNPYFVWLGRNLGADKLYSYQRKLQLLTAVVTGYPHAYQQPDWNRVWQDNLTNLSIGQGQMQLTPLQVARLTALIARGGIDIQPRLVQEIRDDFGRVESRFAPAQPQRLLSEATARQLQGMMRLVVSQGSGQLAELAPGVAGKTGTAQRSNGQLNCWFTAFYPTRQPRVVLTVLVEGGESGGKTAAPVAREILQGLANLY
ncbi:penicillin-binding protein 2 [Carboxydocella thermautotrophica]|nr:penicillin-binding protein 2 [Carboxydocella thermautotrophica]